MNDFLKSQDYVDHLKKLVADDNNRPANNNPKCSNCLDKGFRSNICTDQNDPKYLHSYMILCTCRQVNDTSQRNYNF